MRGCTLRQTYSCSARLRHPAPTYDSVIALSRLSPLRTQHGNKVDTPKIDNIVFTRACRATAPAVGRESRSPHGGESSPRTRLPSPNLAVPRAAPARRGPEGVAHRASACGRGAVESGPGPKAQLRAARGAPAAVERVSGRRAGVPPDWSWRATRGYKDGDRCLCGVRIEAGARSPYYPIPLLRQGCALHLSFLQRRSLFILRAKHERENTSLTIACAQRRV